MTSSSKQMPGSVLIVDASDDSREVLRTILSKRGVQIFEAREENTGLAIAKTEHPKVIVVDIDAPTNDLAVCDELAEQADIDRASGVLLGSIRHWKGTTPREIVRKPYHFAPLIRKIEALLAESSCESQSPATRNAA